MVEWITAKASRVVSIGRAFSAGIIRGEIEAGHAHCANRGSEYFGYFTVVVAKRSVIQTCSVV